MSEQIKLPKVNCKLAGEDGNAFFIMGRFQAAAKRAKWPEEPTRLQDRRSSGNPAPTTAPG